MNRVEILINQYVSADETERLHLYLAHRELRDRFIVGLTAWLAEVAPSR